jgi:OmpA-OmpF porin, OOP family
MKRVLLLLISISFLSGCTVWYKEDLAMTEEDVNQCQVGVSLTGTTVGAFASPLGAGAGAVIGALLGHHFCGPVGQAPAPMAAPSDTIYWNDEDGDGVNDSEDACPKTPLGVPVDSTGCANDNDGDGVPDYLDKCPETPLGNVVDTNGCSLALVKLQGIHFKFDSAALTSEAKSILDRSLTAIKSNPSANLSVEGHTDSTGSDSYNLDLSQRRAESVVKYLVSKGVSSSRLNAKGFGESNPVVANDSASSRAQNRRVEIYAR